jgi:predicted transcriptional regulator
MNPVTRLMEMSERTAPGLSPDFLPAHIWKTLELLHQDILGRKSLSTEINLGEGTVRNIIRRLKEEGFISTSKRGMRLTSRGKEFYRELHFYLQGIEFPFSSITVAPQNYAVLVKGGACEINLGIEQRDEAIIVGAEGATTIVYSDDLRFPGVNHVIEEDVENFLFEHLEPVEGDAIIVGSSHTKVMAQIGAISSAIELYSVINK